MEHNEKDCHPLIDLRISILHNSGQSCANNHVCSDIVSTPNRTFNRHTHATVHAHSL